MLKMLRKQKAQGTLEYAVLIIIVIGALLAMQAYLRRGLQGRLRQASDDIGDQYSVGNMDVQKVTTFNSGTRETYAQGVQNTVITAAETTDVQANQFIINAQWEGWGGQ